MDITPTAEFREACRRILGADDPATVLPVLAEGGPLARSVLALHADLVEQMDREGRTP